MLWNGFLVFGKLSGIEIVSYKSSNKACNLRHGILETEFLWICIKPFNHILWIIQCFYWVCCMSDFITDTFYKRQSEETPSKYRELLISSLKSTFRCSRSIFTLSRSSWKLALLELNERPTIDSTQGRWNTTFLLIKASNISWTHGRIEFMLCANLFLWYVSFLEYYWLVLHAVEVSFQLKYFY